MSQRLSRVFATAKEQRRGVLVAYLCVGDPDVEASLAIARALLAAGADVLELGAPFSDPTADGPVIARASARAIAAGGSMRAAIAVGARLRAESDAPLVLFGYCNPIVVRGERATVEAVADAGIDAMLVVDMPPEEGAELRAEARARGVDVIPLLTPTSSASRIAAAKASASGFVYYVSVTGVTGATTRDPFDDAARAAARLREEMSLPVVVGFGIDDADKARRALVGADGVVVGTAIVRAVEERGADVAGAAAAAADVVRRIRAGV
ncbi:MAG: tryptophan synthase subunit alpha [Myxococcales bacterium]|nr:tryptophan synthase subunit alpha [Myxococcales bacterium]